MISYDYLLLVPLLPLASFVLTGLFGKKLPPAFSGAIATLSLFAAAGLSFYGAWQYFFVNGAQNGMYEQLTVFQYNWLPFTESLSINIGLLADPISLMMLVVITGVSSMVHLFSLGYMKGEERFSVYFAYLSLFTFSMLGLVLSVNILQMFIFWELVGVSSFLLIGFYFKKPEAVRAANKAFIVTRFADLGFLTGILILSWGTGSLDFSTMIHNVTSSDPQYLSRLVVPSVFGLSLLSISLLLIFMGGAGKSAMFPLHIWLPDAMEGPTPVSALIHAATMVVAGVYLVARLFPVYVQAPAVLEVIAFIGIFTSLFAALIACTQNDIKRVLAYSTVSQIGYMIAGLGVTSGSWGPDGEGFTASMFHLFTHASFKALLFLSAGVIIHTLHTNEITNMGGMRKYLPITHIVFLIACLSISGIPPFSGFFSKEAILLTASHNNPAVYWTGVITAGLTAFYMFRLYFMVFFNRPAPDLHHHHSHEKNIAFALPLILLAGASVGAGFIPFRKYVSPDLVSYIESHHEMIYAPLVAGVLGILISALFYFKANDKAEKIASSLGFLYRAACRKFYVDELYLFITKKIILGIVAQTAAWIDRNIVDGMMNGIAWITQTTSEKIKSFQSGHVQEYAYYFLAGILILAVLILN